MSNSWLKNILSSISPLKSGEEELITYSEKINRSELFWKQMDSNKYFTQEYFDILKPLVLEDRLSGETEILGTILNTPYARGFIFYREDVDANDLFFMIFESLRANMLEMGYFLSNSKKDVKEDTGFRKEKEVYYLKPEYSINEETHVHDQKYGQVLLEHYIEDNESRMIKVLVTYYNGRQYSEPLSFTDLINHICNAA